MTYPSFPEKHKYDPLISPELTLEYMRKMGRFPGGTPPKRVIFCYQGSFFERVTKRRPGHFSPGRTFRQVYWLDEVPGTAIAEFGVGAPNVVLKMELLIAWGVKEFISIGTAGGIAPDLKIGDLVGCDCAIRDEGTSHHYLPTGKFAYPTDGGAFASKFGRRGTSWTLDAFFRHTREEIATYQKEGVQTVEMEASAIFAVAEARKVSIGSGFVVSDLLTGDNWDPQFFQEPVEKGLDQLLELALQ